MVASRRLRRFYREQCFAWCLGFELDRVWLDDFFKVFIVNLFAEVLTNLPCFERLRLKAAKNLLLVV